MNSIPWRSEAILFYVHPLGVLEILLGVSLTKWSTVVYPLMVLHLRCRISQSKCSFKTPYLTSIIHQQPVQTLSIHTEELLCSHLMINGSRKQNVCDLVSTATVADLPSINDCAARFPLDWR